jgi:FixJ family two-component response regulator
MTGKFVIYLLDDDRVAVSSMSQVLRSKGYDVRAFASAKAFFAAHDPSAAGCVIADFFLPDIDGQTLQTELAMRNADRPIIFTSGRIDLAAGVSAMKSGAVDFLTKPVNTDDLLAALALAYDREMAARKRRSELESICSRLAMLTPREKQVLSGVVTGLMNKQIAQELGVVEKTVKVHRGKMMHKMAVRSVAELVRISDRAGLSVMQTRFA